jgi:hypothetical protein
MSFENLPPLDVKSFVNAVVVLIMLGGILSFWRGVQGVRSSYSINYIRVRRTRVAAGWRLILFGFFLVFVGSIVKLYGEPVAYRYIPITLTPTWTPTETPLPTFTLIPTSTTEASLDSESGEPIAPAGTPTPHIPMAVEVMFEGQVTPPADAVFSPLTFSHGLDLSHIPYTPLNPGTEFDNPVGHLYASFTYDKMVPGVQWTALWYREAELVYYETGVWEQGWGSGGSGFSDWDPNPGDWLPGNYWVEIFIGHIPKVVGTFTVYGIPPTATLSPIQPTSPVITTLTITPTP